VGVVPDDTESSSFFTAGAEGAAELEDILSRYDFTAAALDP
jgi:hypothetical protein